MAYELDNIDKRIIHALMDDARNVSATALADELGVSDGTIHNRIDRLEREGVISGYQASINFERAGGHLVGIFMCTVPAAEREQSAMAARAIPGVINVRVLMAGKRDLHVVAVGKTTEDLRQIGRQLSELGIAIEDEELVQTEFKSPYEPFGPGREAQADGIAEIWRTESARILEITVAATAPIVDQTVKTARDNENLADTVSLLAIRRGTEIITPSSETVLNAGDIVTVLDRSNTEGIGVVFGQEEPARL